MDFSDTQNSDSWYAVTADPAERRKERQKARRLRHSQWWKNIIGRGLCHYCGEKFPPKELTMDHIVPLARGGTSTKGNIVPACSACNADKKLATPAELLLTESGASDQS